MDDIKFNSHVEKPPEVRVATPKEPTSATAAAAGSMGNAIDEKDDEADASGMAKLALIGDTYAPPQTPSPMRADLGPYVLGHLNGLIAAGRRGIRPEPPSEELISALGTLAYNAENFHEILGRGADPIASRELRLAITHFLVADFSGGPQHFDKQMGRLRQIAGDITQLSKSGPRALRESLPEGEMPASLDNFKPKDWIYDRVGVSRWLHSLNTQLGKDDFASDRSLTPILQAIGNLIRAYDNGTPFERAASFQELTYASRNYLPATFDHSHTVNLLRHIAEMGQKSHQDFFAIMPTGAAREPFLPSRRVDGRSGHGAREAGIKGFSEVRAASPEGDAAGPRRLVETNRVGRSFSLMSLQYREWKSSNKPLFDEKTGEPSPDDIQQSTLSNCETESILASLARNHPDFIKEMVQPKKDEPGVYLVRFFDTWIDDKKILHSKPIYIEVDNKTLRSADGRHAHNKSNVLWPEIVQKAYGIFLHDSGEAAEAPRHDLHRGHRKGVRFSHFTGKDSFALSTRTEGARTFFEGSMSTAMETYQKEGRLMTAGADGNIVKLGNGVAVRHMYEVVRIYEKNGQRMIELRNPWGFFGSKPGRMGQRPQRSPEVIMPFDKFAKMFDVLHVGLSPS